MKQPLSKLNDTLLDSATKPLLLYYSMGRLGNQIFEYASAYCLAKKSKHSLVIYNDNMLLKCFGNISATIKETNKTKIKHIIHFREKFEGVFEEEILNKITSNGNAEIYGHLQSWKYFNDCTDDILPQFQFLPSIENQAKQFIRYIIYY
jgi:hypothetical protein